MSQQSWDASQGANPDTCLHLIVGSVIPIPFLVICASCGSTIDRAYWDEFEWDYDIDHGLWFRCSIRESKRRRRGQKLAQRILSWRN